MNVFKRGMIFVTFFGCCFGMSLMAAALGTQFWFEASALQRDSTKNFTEFRPEASGTIHFGLFTGVKVLNWGIGDRINTFYVVCMDSLCMYSAEETEEAREASINQTIHQYDLGRMSTIPLHHSPSALLLKKNPPFPLESERVPELMSEGLWVATITMLFSGLVFAVLGATFAVINTATTPIEFITGVPGLYVWNGCAAVCGLTCVILWGIQYSLHLTSNVLIENAEEGWTTEGLQHLGYSYWLVVVSVVVHLANCCIIGVGTYERKVKTQYEAPETKPGNIMLY